jgi:hypothetical protein
MRPPSGERDGAVADGNVGWGCDRGGGRRRCSGGALPDCFPRKVSPPQCLLIAHTRSLAQAGRQCVRDQEHHARCSVTASLRPGHFAAPDSEFLPESRETITRKVHSPCCSAALQFNAIGGAVLRRAPVGGGILRTRNVQPEDSSRLIRRRRRSDRISFLTAVPSGISHSQTTYTLHPSC